MRQDVKRMREGAEELFETVRELTGTLKACAEILDEFDEDTYDIWVSIQEANELVEYIETGVEPERASEV